MRIFEYNIVEHIEFRLFGGIFYLVKGSCQNFSV